MNGPAVAVAIVLIGWVLSVAIRTFQGEHVEVIVEMTGAGFAAGVIYKTLGGGSGGQGKEGTP